VKTTFKDVGLEGAKEEIQEIVEFLKTQRNTQTSVVKFKRSFTCRSSWNREDSISGCRRSASAIFSLSGSDFVEMFVGVGASRVRDLFKQAKEKSPAIIFIDEIDAVGRARGKSNMSGGNDEREIH
jgi:cell division protease FtsH